MNYTLTEKTNLSYPYTRFYTLKFTASDGSDIVADIALPKQNFKKIMFEFPDYAAFPKDYLNLARYSMLGYGVVSLHIRGQSGQSKNQVPYSIYAPFTDSTYFKLVFEDAKQLIKIIDDIYPNLVKYVLGIGQGASIASVVESELHCFEAMFIGNILLSDYKLLIDSNLDVQFYNAIGLYLKHYPYDEDHYLYELSKIDVSLIASKITTKVYYAMSHLDKIAPLCSQKSFVEKLQNVEIIHYRKFEHEVLQEHFFDEWILFKLAEFEENSL